MKKMKLILVLITLIFVFSSCKKEDFGDRMNHKLSESSVKEFDNKTMQIIKDTINIMFFVESDFVNSFSLTLNEKEFNENSLGASINDVSAFDGNLGYIFVDSIGSGITFISVKIPITKHDLINFDYWFNIGLCLDERVGFVFNENTFNKKMTFANNNLGFLEPSVGQYFSEANDIRCVSNLFWIKNGRKPLSTKLSVPLLK